MKKQSFTAKILSLVMVIGVLFTLASCGGGSLKLDSFVVDTSTIKTSYVVGEEIDFSGIKAYAKYSDEALNKTYTFGELTITYDADITATAGTKQVYVSFMDPNLDGEEQKIPVTIIVTDPQAVVVNATVAGYQKPDSLVSFAANNKNGTLTYGSSGFMGEFINGNKTYVIGDDNEFNLLPKITVIDESGIPQILSMFHATVEMYLYDGTEYVALTKEAVADHAVAFYSGETLIADVDTLTGTYDFSEAAVGEQIKISVLPDAEYYSYGDNVHAVVLEAAIIDAYNVHEAWQLAVIDNDTSRDLWDTFKTEKGISELSVAGIVLHNDIKLTANDVPDSLFYTTDKEVVYTNSTDPTDKIIKPAGTKYLKDKTNIYQRKGAGDFTINGNFFTLNTSDFPLVASPNVFGSDSGKDYGEDFSNSTLIRFECNGSTGTTPDDVANVTIDNMAVIGNAKRDNYIDHEKASKGYLASAGGLIFIKSTWHTDMTINNVIGNSFFITYFSDYYGRLVANDVKCYDSYQNAGFVYAEAYLEFNDSYLNGCGGPVVIAQSLVDEELHPTVVTNDTILDTRLTGTEIWFVSLGATTVVSGITAMDAVLEAYDLGNFVNPSNSGSLKDKMNILGLLMTEGFTADTVVSDSRAQGVLTFDDDGIERLKSTDPTNNPTEWDKVVNNPAYGQGAPFFSVTDEDGEVHYLFYNGYYLCDYYGNQFSKTTHAKIYNAFYNADRITISQGGISVVFEFYH